MLKRFAALALVFIVALTAAGCAETQPDPPPDEPKPPDFRASNWADSRAEVEKAQLPEEVIFADEESMFYEIDEGGEALLVYFFFEDDALVRGECRIEMGGKEWSVRVPEMIASYEAFRNDIIALYGAPLEPDHRVWLDKDPDYVDDPDMHNLYYKRLEYLTEWENERSVMSLRLYYKDRDFKFIYEAGKK